MGGNCAVSSSSPAGRPSSSGPRPSPSPAIASAHQVGEEVSEARRDVDQATADRLDDVGGILGAIGDEEDEERDTAPGEDLLDHLAHPPPARRRFAAATVDIVSVACLVLNLLLIESRHLSRVPALAEKIRTCAPRY